MKIHGEGCDGLAIGPESQRRCESHNVLEVGVMVGKQDVYRCLVRDIEGERRMAFQDTYGLGESRGRRQEIDGAHGDSYI